jgi:hypothetical protein
MLCVEVAHYVPALTQARRIAVFAVILGEVFYVILRDEINVIDAMDDTWKAIMAMWLVIRGFAYGVALG